MSKRENLGFETEIRSDTAALHGLVAAMIDAVPDIHCLRDPTRGGLATTLNELAQQSGVGMQIREQAIPVRQEVAAACELLGWTRSMSPTRASSSPSAPPIRPSAARGHARPPQGPRCRHHRRGRRRPAPVRADGDRFGGSRIVDWLAGEQLPRIC
jgi:hydrogenase expression/formation protein HypE